MKARTRKEKEVERLSKRLWPVTGSKKEYALGLIPKEAWWRGRDFGCFCTCCGHEWEMDSAPSETVVCPACGAELKAVRTRKENGKFYMFMAVISVCGKYQVIRFVEARRIIHGKRVFSEAEEVVRLWIDVNGNHLTQTIKYGVMHYNVYWKYGTCMELRNPCFSVNFYVDGICGKQSVLSELRRNGYKGRLNGFTPLDVFKGLLQNSMFETLWKANRFDILKSCTDLNRLRLEWPSVRIVLRNNYRTDDWQIWFDTMSMMRRCGMDVTNSVYVCPDDIRRVHDEVQKRLERMERRKKQVELEEKMKCVDKVLERLSKYGEIRFCDGKWNVLTLHTAKEYFDEGNHMHHCVWSNEYWKKKDCLILSVRRNDDNARVATVELSLSSYTIQQCRGVSNKVPEQVDDIERLIKDNMYRYKRVANNN